MSQIITKVFCTLPNNYINDITNFHRNGFHSKSEPMSIQKIVKTDEMKVSMSKIIHKYDRSRSTLLDKNNKTVIAQYIIKSK